MLGRFEDEEVLVGSSCIRGYILRGRETGTDCGYATPLGHVIGASNIRQAIGSLSELAEYTEHH
jgi:hypothetical protein